MHFIDIENLCGGSEFVRTNFRGVREQLDAALVDHSPTMSVLGHGVYVRRDAPDLWFEWPARFVVGSGIDGADLALLNTLMTEPAARRSNEVVIGSGDGIFTEAVTYLQPFGVRVVVASFAQALSRRLALAADEVVLLDSVVACDAA